MIEAIPWLPRCLRICISVTLFTTANLSWSHCFNPNLLETVSSCCHLQTRLISSFTDVDVNLALTWNSPQYVEGEGILLLEKGTDRTEPHLSFNDSSPACCEHIKYIGTFFQVTGDLHRGSNWQPRPCRSPASQLAIAPPSVLVGQHMTCALGDPDNGPPLRLGCWSRSLLRNVYSQSLSPLHVEIPDPASGRLV